MPDEEGVELGGTTIPREQYDELLRYIPTGESMQKTELTRYVVNQFIEMHREKILEETGQLPPELGSNSEE